MGSRKSTHHPSKTAASRSNSATPVPAAVTVPETSLKPSKPDAVRPGKPGQELVSFSGSWIANAHTLFASAAFLGAFVVGVSLHFHKIVQNEHFGYPIEWFPSVSATIGDRYPERSVFQVFIAITSGPRFALVFLNYLLAKKPGAKWPMVLLVTGLLRTLTCGGWTYVTSTDDHDWHDIFMISYIVFTLPWTLGRIMTTPPGKALTYRKVLASSFFATLIPLIYLFIQHKVHHVPGAYTYYAFCEWALIVLDVGYDAVTVLDFSALQIRVVDTAGIAYPVLRQDQKSERKHHGFGILRFIAMVGNSFILWSAMTALPLLIWYFPLWYMGVSGYEVFIVLVGAIPLLLAIPPFRGLVSYAIPLPLAAVSFSIFSYMAHKPATRLIMTAVGAGIGTLALAVQFWGIQARPYAGLHSATAFSLGLILSSVAKFSLWTNNPIWPIMHAENGGWNNVGIAICLVCALFSSRLQYTKDQPASVAGKKESSIAAALGLAGMIVSMHTFLTDSSTLAIWVWDGYPVKGPLPVPHGIITIFAMCLGTYLGITKKEAAISYKAFAASCVAAAVLCSFHGWLGYAGGFVLAVYLPAIAPSILENAGRHNPAITFGFGFTVVSVIIFLHVLTVAYAFVPGGNYLRERTNVVIALQQLCLLAGVWSVSKISHSPVNNPSVPNSNNVALLAKIKRQAKIVIVGILALTATIDYQRFTAPDIVPFHPEEKLMTTAIWTVHFGLDNDMWASEVRMRNVLEELEADVIGILESDTMRHIMGYRDLTQRIAEEVGYYVDVGPGPNKHTWGCALFSKFPILNSTHHLLPSPVGELAPAIHATLDVYGENVDVVVFHSGQEEDPEDRRLQSLYLADLMKNAVNPTILLSYLVTTPLEGNYNTYVGELSNMKDIDSTDWDRWCEYILYKDIKRVGYARVSRDSITDTEIQLGKFVVGDKTPSTEVRIEESKVPVGRRFPDMFKGFGVRGHRYHVFDEPRYFE